MLDLFSGIGGFTLAARHVWGDELETVQFVEQNKQCQKILRRHFPNVQITETIQEFIETEIPSADIVCGGDPCPVRSKAKSIWKSKSPDLSGYFLAVVGISEPRWVLRENVLSSDDKDFSTGLEVLGYRTLIIRVNAYSHTGQNRTRDVIVGCSEKTGMRQFRELYQRNGHSGGAQEKREKAEGYPCLTTHHARYDARDGYIYDGGRSIRIADRDERTQLAGFPAGWLDGMSKTAISRMTGNAVVPQCVIPIMEAIRDAES